MENLYPVVFNFDQPGTVMFVIVLKPIKKMEGKMEAIKFTVNRSRKSTCQVLIHYKISFPDSWPESF